MSTPNDASTSHSTIRLLGVAELRKRAHSRLLERIDPARTRHKPLSIIRLEARRIVEQLFDQDAAHIVRKDRDRLLEDILAEAFCVGLMEDLYRDDAIKEILILAHNQVIGKKNDIWLPSSVRFRDVEQLRSVLNYYASVGEHLIPPGPASGGLDLRLPNNFRVIAILPPVVMELPPQVLLIRNGAPASEVIKMPKSGHVASPNPSGIMVTPMPSRIGQSDTVNLAGNPRNTQPSSGSVSFNLTATAAEGASGRYAQLNSGMPSPVVDPYARFRQKVSERIVVKFAAAGVYDLNQVPLPDLRRIILAHIGEYSVQEKMGYDESTMERMALEILANMNR